ncbi:MAG: ABC transporter ATP-binding protein/permease [Firmicutes bacterium]|nr:ABC transporter ATP-binding protein/permease [Bacillota bacterium]
MKHSLLGNMSYVYSESIKKYPKVKWFLLVNFFTELLVPFLTIVITTILVYSLTNNIVVGDYVLIILCIIIATYLLETLRFWSLTRYTFENTFARVSTFTLRLSEHQLKTDYINVETKDRRNIISKAYEAINSNYFGIEMLLRQTPLLFINAVGIIVYGVLIALYVPIVLLILVFMTIINYLLTKRANLHLSKMNTKLNDEFREKYYLSKDSTNPNYGKDIRIYKIGEWFDKLFVRLTKSRRMITEDIEKKFFFANVSNTIFLFIRDFAGYILLLGLVVNHEISLTTFTFFIGIVTGFSMWLNGFTRALNELRSSNIKVNDYRDCITVENEYDKIGKIRISDLKLPLSIEFENVTFSYPNSDTPVIDNLSFKINPEEKVALVGNNGAGKTTIIKLLCGLYRPDSGVIRVGGYDIKDFNIAEYMSLLSVVFQDSEPLSFTIENNITCKDSEEVDSEKLWDAIEKAGLKEKITSLEKKEKTNITQMFDKSGVRLSGGETQKMMLARSLYKKAPLLILDEPTAALDPIAEEEMYLKYKELVKNTTSIFISHRLSSTKFCDWILLLDHGKIIEKGTHQELMNLSKEYKSIFDTQAQYYKDGGNCEDN